MESYFDHSDWSASLLLFNKFVLFNIQFRICFSILVTNVSYTRYPLSLHRFLIVGFMSIGLFTWTELCYTWIQKTLRLRDCFSCLEVHDCRIKINKHGISFCRNATTLFGTYLSKVYAFYPNQADKCHA